VAEVIGGELEFVPLGAEPKFGDGHDAGVVDQDVQRAGVVLDQAVDRGAVEQVQLRHRDRLVGGAGADVGGDALGRSQVACGDERLGAGRGQRAGGLHADTARSAGDQRATAAQVDAGDDIGGGGREVER
jgi:hypothetical protein